VTLLYLDASALMKLVRHEEGTRELDLFIGDADIVSSELALVEIMRAARRAPAIDPRLGADAIAATAGELLESVALLPLQGDVLVRAANFPEPFLRALDAIHVASALSLTELDAFVTYDERQAAAARMAGLRTIAPGLV
jgi:uncharacterized protein